MRTCISIMMFTLVLGYTDPCSYSPVSHYAVTKNKNYYLATVSEVHIIEIQLYI